MREAVIRSSTLFVSAVTAACVALLASTAWPFREMHLGEIPAPVAAAVEGRIATLAARHMRSDADTTELGRLTSLRARLARKPRRLGDDLAALSAAAETFRRLGSRGALFDAAMTEGFRLAAIAMNEREDLLGDTRDMLVSGSQWRRVGADGARAATARAAADGAHGAATRARRLVGAETLLTRALADAERRAKRFGLGLPPERLRSGDSVDDRRGALVAVPRGSGTPIDGASVLIPRYALPWLTRAITLASAAPILGGSDIAAGEALAVGPAGLVLNLPVTVRMPYTAGAVPGEFGVLRGDAKGPVALKRPQWFADGTIAAETTVLGTFQPGVLAPRAGAPDGRYELHVFAISSRTGTNRPQGHGACTTSQPPSCYYDPGFDPSLNAGTFTQEIEFGRDGSGTAAPGAWTIVGRAFTESAQRHTDRSSVGGDVFGYEFAWTLDGPGRFSTSNGPLGVALQGGISSDGGVIVFTGHAGRLDLIGIGLRTESDVATEDLAGRWVATEIAVELLDDGAPNFRTRWTSGLRHFDADSAGVLTFDESGTIRRADTEYRAGDAAPEHARTQSEAADGGSRTVTVDVNGRIAKGPQLVPDGRFSKRSGVLVLTTLTAWPANPRAGFLVAARQPAAADPSVLPGRWNLARLDLGSTAGAPTADTSTTDVLARPGTLALDAYGSADLVLDAGARSVHTLTGPSLASRKWVLASAATAAAHETSALSLDFDASGNHRQGPVLYGVSGDGSVLLGSVVGGDPLESLGIVIGLR